MPFVKAMCTNCGGILQVDESKDAAVCPFCSTPYIVEKAINNYQINIQYKIENSNVYINNGISIDKKIENAEYFISVHHDYDKAESIFMEASELAPMDYRTWWGIVRAQTWEFSYFGFDDEGLDDVRQYLESAIKVAGDKKDELIKKWDQYMTDYNILIDLDVKRKSITDKMNEIKVNKAYGSHDVSLIIGSAFILFGLIVLPVSFYNGKGINGLLGAAFLFIMGGFFIFTTFKDIKLANQKYDVAKKDLDEILKKMLEVDMNNTWFDN